MGRHAGRTPPARAGGSLIVVGTGITGVGQTTLEAVAAMQQAEKLFYLVIDSVTETWIRELNPAATSLSALYAPGKQRRRTYEEMTKLLVDSVREGFRVCAAFYGHPGVLVQASHAAIRRLRRVGCNARMIPGISADACLIADLGLNPGDRGLQSFEATEFLLSKRRWDAESELILWQVGVLGETGSEGTGAKPERLKILTSRLRRRYPADHRVVLYYASLFPTQPPIVQKLRLERLPKAKVAPLALLYVPALPSRRELDPRILTWYRS